MKLVHNFICICCLLLPYSLYADNATVSTPQPLIGPNWDSIPFVSISDPTVISASNFAAKTIQRGSLYKTVFAQKQSISNGVVYVLTLEVVDIHFRHHRYSVQVFMPSDKSPWQVIYFTPVQY